jgi:hypothetical protein
MLTPRMRITSRVAMQRFLLDDLRIDDSQLNTLDLDVVRSYAQSGIKKAQLRALLGCLEALR